MTLAVSARAATRGSDGDGEAKDEQQAARADHVRCDPRRQGGCSSTRGPRPAMLRHAARAAMNRPETSNRPSIARRGERAARAGRIGVLIVNLGTPDATDAGSVRRYLREFLSDRARDREPGPGLEVRAQRHHPATRPRRKGLDYEKIWNRERNESPLKTITRAQAGKAPRHARRDRARRRGRLGDALRQSVARHPHRGAGQGRLRAHPAAAALSAIRRGDHRDGLRRGVRRRCTRCATSRRCAWCRRTTTIRSISRRWRLRSRPSCKRLPFAAGADPRLVPRHSEILRRRRRSLSAPLRGDGAAAARAARPRRAAS